MNKEYQDSLLNNQYWENVKRIIKVRDNESCSCCGSLTQLHVHHITYKINGKTIVGSELRYLNWLITVCEKCHLKIHKERNHLLNPKSFFKINAFDWFALKGIKI